MNRDRDLNEFNGASLLLRGDQRVEPRRACRATVWRLDDDLRRAVELGAAVEISREGVTFTVPPCRELLTDSLRPGREWLVLIDDPTGLEPLARQRMALLRLIRAAEQEDGSWRLACRFASRSPDRCTARRAHRAPRIAAEISDVLAGDLLDELADRLGRDLTAADRAESWREV